MKIARFGVVEIVNTMIDFAVLILLLGLFGVTNAWPLVLCNAAAFIGASLVWNYLACRYGVFWEKR
jgi:putative flippase GtrA